MFSVDCHLRKKKITAEKVWNFLQFSGFDASLGILGLNFQLLGLRVFISLCLHKSSNLECGSVFLDMLLKREVCLLVLLLERIGGDYLEELLKCLNLEHLGWESQLDTSP